MKYTFYIAITAIFLVMPAFVQAQANDTETDDMLASITKQLEYFQAVLWQREGYAETGVIAKSIDDPDYFSVVVDTETLNVYGQTTDYIEIKADGSVDQLLLLTDCDAFVGQLKLNKRDCSELNWSLDFAEENGVRTFMVPIRFSTELSTVSQDITLIACRYNGCQVEAELEVVFKDEITFADQVRVYDRYEWEYEWDDNIYHVQEVLLSFPDENIRRVKLRMTCDAQGLYIRTDEEDRATCNSRRDYSEVDYGEVEVDDLGNVYNLRIESVTNDIQANQAGVVTMHFDFITWQNQTIYEVEHIPQQREQIETTEE